MEAADYLRKRTQANLSQAEVSRRTGYDRSHVRRVETGQNNPSAAYEAAFLAALSDRHVIEPGKASIDSLERSRQIIARQAKRLASNKEALEDSRIALSAAAHNINIITRQLDVIVGSRPYDSDSFDPEDATPAQIESLECAIVSVMVEIMADHNMQTLDSDSIASFLNGIASKATKELGRTRERSELDTFVRTIGA
jgi:transcriptional regulator with XRE-family HTH domain